ncbi:MAG: MAPEG family protein, partial [Proteobacteria bacterium]|nr:MAPEG family protein [Pseudomonadota bacterium]
VLLFSVGFMRYRSVANRTVKLKDYVLMTGQNQWPVMIQRLGRSFQNQLEMPLLFYVLALLILITGVQSMTLVSLAWIYVGLRYIHAFIHVIYNRVTHRFAVFLVSSLVLLVMWVWFMVELSALP